MENIFTLFTLKEFIREAEEKLNFDQLKFLRERALKKAERTKAFQEDQIKNETENTTDIKQESSWTGYWFSGWYGGKKDELQERKLPEKIAGGM